MTLTTNAVGALKLRAAADYLSVNESTMRELVKSGAIVAVRVGVEWRIRVQALEDYLDGRTTNLDEIAAKRSSAEPIAPPKRRPRRTT